MKYATEVVNAVTTNYHRSKGINFISVNLNMPSWATSGRPVSFSLKVLTYVCYSVIISEQFTNKSLSDVEGGVIGFTSKCPNF